MGEPIHLNLRTTAQQEALTRPVIGKIDGNDKRQIELNQELKPKSEIEARKLFDQGKISEEEFRKRLGLPKN